MELQFHSTTRDPISWASLRFPPNDTTRGYQECQRQGISGFADHTGDPTFHRSTAGLTGNNSPFSETEAPRSSRLKHIIIPKPNRPHVQYTGQDSLYQDRPYWDTQQSLSRQDGNRFTASPSFVRQDLNKLHGLSYKTTELSSNNSYKHSRRSMDSEPCPPRKKCKGSAVSAGRDEENSVSAFKVFKRNNNNHQFSRIKERNKNLPPPPPLVKANGKMNRISNPETKSAGEEIIVICDSPPLPAQARPVEKYQSDSRKDPLRASKLETISHGTLHHCKPISSTRVHSMDYRPTLVATGNCDPREIESMEPLRSCHCHHYDNVAYISKGSTRYSNLNDRTICTAKATPFVNQNTTRSQCEPHTGIQCHTDYHNGISYSPINCNKTSGQYKNKCSTRGKVLDPSSPSLIGLSPEALHAWRLRSHLTGTPSNSQINSSFDADIPRNNSKKVSSNLSDSRSSIKQDVSAFKEPRLQLKEHRPQTPVVNAKALRSQINHTEHPTIHKKSEYPYQKSKVLPFRFMNQKMSKMDHANLSKFFEIHCQAKNSRQQFMITQKPSRIPEIHDYHDIQKLPVSESPGVESPSVTQKLKHAHAQKQETLLSLLLPSNSKGKVSSVLTNATRDKAILPSGLTDSALISHRKGNFSQLPVSSSPAKGCGLCSSGNVETRGNPAVMSQMTCLSKSFNGDCLPIPNDRKAFQEKKPFAMPSKSNACCSPPGLDSNKKSHKEIENQKAISSQPITKSVSTDAQKAPPLAQKKHVALFGSPPQSRRLSHPLENDRFKENHSDENSSAPLQRSKSEGDQETHCDVSSLLESFKEDETIAQLCGGYAFDHDSLPIIVAVHSVVVKNNSQQGIESSQEEKTKDPAIASSHCVEDAPSSPKNEPNGCQRPVLPKLDTLSENTKLPDKMQVSGDQSAKKQLSQSSSSSSSSSSPQPPPSSSSSSSSSSTIPSFSSLLTFSSSSSLPPSSITSILVSSSSVMPSSSLMASSSSSLPPPSSSSSSLPSASSSSPATAVAIEQPVNTVSAASSIATHSNDDKQISKSPKWVNTNNPFSNDLMLKERVGSAIQVDVNAANTDANATSVSTNGSALHLPAKSAEEVESKGRTSKLIVHRRNSVEELSNKIVETRERIDKEDIDWKKKLLRRLEYVLIKKLKKAEKETGEKASIDLAPEKSVKGKDEQKKAKSFKRNKSCTDETSSKVEQAEKDEKEKSENVTTKKSDKINEANKSKGQKKGHQSKCDITVEPSDTNVYEQSRSKLISRKESVDSITMSQEETHTDFTEETLSNKNEILISSVNGIITVEQCSDDHLPSLNSAEEDEDFADFSCSDLVIAE